MKTKTTQLIPAALVLVAVSFRYFSTWCIDSISSCYSSWIHQSYQHFTYPLFLFSLYFLPFAIVLALIPRHLFNSWLKLAAWAIPLAFIFIATTPVNWTGIGINFFPFYRDDAARLAGEVFAALSLVLIIWKYFAARRGR